ncbi:ABC transporter substrate-binding protein [Microbacterium sp.]|uniref:ABC transporter substrate-binding protein n=1 Tax=Microbacterium sp. TaxID=51671 RepID=UPI001AC526B2|nr:ABC transporter substrate-binding protein [Microbacterium sp.]MBN9188361.1 hypothetical protein [Microbacterium sp.]MBN9192029.1 hypothetical protein [Microbacterium sp.]
MSFRGFRTRALAVASVTVAVAIALAGCAGGSASPQNSNGRAAQLTYSFLGPPQLGMSPFETFGGQSIIYATLAYSTVLRTLPDGTIAGDLAKKWGYVGAGNREFQFTLRDDATFADGTKVDAAAVVASLEAVRDGSYFQSNIWQYFTSISADGTDAVTIKLSQPVANIEHLLTPEGGNAYIVNPKALKNTKALANATDGSGPYVYDAASSVANSSYVFTRNPHYYAPDLVKADKVVVKNIADPNAVLNAAETGQVDIGLADSTVAAAAEKAGLKVMSIPTAAYGIGLYDRAGTLVPALGDLRVRQAINIALDRKSITSSVISGGLGVPTDQLTVKGLPGYSADLEDYYPYDIAKAKQLLADAGYANGFTFTLLCTPLINTCGVAQAAAAQLKQVGITVKIDSVGSSIAQYVSVLSSGKVPASILGMPPTVFGFGPTVLPDTGPSTNPFKTDDPTAVGLWNQLSASSAGAQQDELAVKLLTRLTEQAWFAPIYVMPTVYVYGKNVTGFDASSANFMWPTLGVGLK